MIFWAITLVVSLKYVLVVLRADNDGEGGILALLALVLRQLPASGHVPGAASLLGLFGAAMFYGDSVITPAISVLSAVEGLEVVSPQLRDWVIPMTLAILLGAVRRPALGTGARRQRVRADHGRLVRRRSACSARSQIARTRRARGRRSRCTRRVHACDTRHGGVSLSSAAVFLAVTGGEALYADMGHFGRRPIRLAWFWLVLPACC